MKKNIITEGEGVKMMSEKFYKKLMEITKVMEEKGEGISYIHNETETYTIGTKKYNEEIANYLDKTIESWEGSEAHVKKKKGKNKQEKGKKVGYLWKIPITDS
ncbi:MAG: hypothetical protein PHY59_06470 [Methanobacterium sp.]|nr:hypothetical protein [Methanobacterium sp.]